MKLEIKVPTLGESVTEASISAILKESGAVVATDDEIVELETDKVNQVLYSPSSGKLTLTVGIDQTVQIGDVIGFVDSDVSVPQDTTVPTEPAPVAKEAAPAPKAIPQEVAEKVAVTKTIPPRTVKAAAPASSPARSASAPGVRKMKESFLDELRNPPPLTQIAAPASAAVSGGAAAPTKQTTAPDPHPLAVTPPPSGEARPEVRKRMSRIRKVIASRLVEAQASTAMLTTFNEVDMTAVMELRKRYKDTFLKRHGVKLGFMSFFVKAVVSALMDIPGLNSYIDGDESVEREYYDIGIAVSSEKGLVVPVVRNCDRLSFAMIENAIGYFARKARSGKLAVDELQGGGFTITNGGVFGSLVSTPILNSPQSGILGMHKIQERPVAIDGKVEIRPMMYLALSYDHRIVDGKEAVTFLVNIKDTLEDPSRFLLDI
ncbi:MAG: 2-oxoglutarate dehydrogenase E2 component (dihydrolipoamide succinyltransferase) [Chlamydiales bacterium]|jgi:2-oxoglutarate dehydrogenase E2 component (dihydrolipoamide succinyltransferase)